MQKHTFQRQRLHFLRPKRNAQSLLRDYFKTRRNRHRFFLRCGSGSTRSHGGMDVSLRTSINPSPLKTHSPINPLPFQTHSSIQLISPSKTWSNTMLSYVANRLLFLIVIFSLYWTVQISGILYYIDFLNFTKPRADTHRW